MENRAIFTQKSRMVGLFVLIILAILCLAIGAGMRGVGVSAKNTQDWISFHGSTDLKYADGALQVRSYTNPGSIVFTGGQFSDYEMEADLGILKSP